MAKSPKNFGLAEPDRVTELDILKKNLETVGRVTFLHRIIYLARHSSPGEELVAMFQNVVKLVNSEYCDEKLTGFLLIYKGYFLHVVEGDEEAIQRHFVEGNVREFCGKHSKVLVYLNHVAQRLCPEWFYYETSPQELMEQVCSDSAAICLVVRKIYALIRDLNAGQDKDIVKNLPEFCLLDYLLKNSLYSVKQFCGIYNNVSARNYANFDTIEALPEAFVPFFIYDQPFKQ